MLKARLPIRRNISSKFIKNYCMRDIRPGLCVICRIFVIPVTCALFLGFLVEIRFYLDHEGYGNLRFRFTASRGHENTHRQRQNHSDTIPFGGGAHIVRDPRVVTSREWDIVIVGAGLSGAVLAERFATVMGKSVLVIERRDHIGGNCFDYVDPETGILVSKYGPHLFHTDNERVWAYLQRFSKWRRYDHQVARRAPRASGRLLVHGAMNTHELYTHVHVLYTRVCIDIHTECTRHMYAPGCVH